MIKVVKFMEKVWIMLCILTFLIGLYWSFKGQTFDALYFFGFSLVSLFLFFARRKQRKIYERNNPDE